MPVEALNAVPALARRSAQRGLEAIQAAVAAKAVHKVAAVADISFLGPWTERSLRRRISTESRSWHFCCPRPSAHAALHVRARASHLLRGLCAPPQPLPAPTEKTTLSLRSSPSQAGAAAGGSTGYMANSV